jgi:hypothetical protein
MAGKRGTRLNPTPSRTNQHCDQLDQRQLQEPQGDGGAPKLAALGVVPLPRNTSDRFQI